jgi:FixJ family two-component response regulator
VSFDSRNLIAIVDDDQAVRVGLGSLLRSLDLPNELYPGADELLATDLDRVAFVLSDVQMPGLDGLELLGRLKELRPDLPVALMTAFPDERIKEKALAGGAIDFCAKPCDPDHIVALIETSLRGRT